MVLLKKGELKKKSMKGSKPPFKVSFESIQCRNKNQAAQPASKSQKPFKCKNFVVFSYFEVNITKETIKTLTFQFL